MRRVVVVGGTGSGKSTVASELASRLRSDVIELDALWWDSDWSPAGRELLRARLLPRLSAERWVVEGYYVDELSDALWPLADTIVWLDISRHVAIRRALRRSVRRAISRSALWNGNRESLSVLSPLSVWRLVRRWPGYSEQIERRLKELQLEDVSIVRLRSGDEVRAWLESA